MLRTEFIVKTVLEALDVLCRETDLSPRNAPINEALSRLVATLAGIYDFTEEQQVLADPRVAQARPQLLEKLSQAEGEMEKFWAEHFLSKESLTYEDLKEFWYWDCYENLVGQEMDCLPPEAVDSERGAVFVGAGALPLTAIILHVKSGMPVTCVDRDPDACAKAAALCSKLGLTGMHIVCADGEDVDYGQFSTVIVASLVPNPAKEAIMQSVSSNQTPAFLAVRTAERLHTLLYEPFEPGAKTMESYRPFSRTVHNPQTINTTLVYRSAPQAAAAQTIQPPLLTANTLG